MSRQIVQSANIYFSPTGTTRKIVRRVSAGLALRPRELDLTLPTARKQNFILEKEELLLAAFPVHGGRLPKLVLDVFNSLPAGRRPAVAVVVYGNRAYEDALLELFDLCVKKDYFLVGAAAFIGEHSYSHVLGQNRPDPADEESARRFGLSVRNTLLGGENVLNEKPLLSLARRPYRKYSKKPDISPDTSRKCVGCLICVKNCPTGAFIDLNPRRVDQEKCILCAACVKMCPEKAKSFNDDDFTDRMAALVAANLDRKEPTVFLP
ncbi:MAG: 4Fe-4S binding protein [Deltaproteobacteria bacterium]|jgi:ferredoxin/flavodoxin|nr:4Fe-4S binding protein [Deltaproteobacteria bacterium]